MLRADKRLAAIDHTEPSDPYSREVIIIPANCRPLEQLRRDGTPCYWDTIPSRQSISREERLRMPNRPPSATNQPPNRPKTVPTSRITRSMLKKCGRNNKGCGEDSRRVQENAQKTPVPVTASKHKGTPATRHIVTKDAEYVLPPQRPGERDHAIHPVYRTYQQHPPPSTGYWAP